MKFFPSDERIVLSSRGEGSMKRKQINETVLVLGVAAAIFALSVAATAIYGALA